MLASVSVLGRAELGSFGVIICVGIEMFIIGRRQTPPSVFAAVPTKNPAIQTSQTIAGHLSKPLLAGQRS